MPWSGVTVPLELTAALPPPAVSGLVEASAPITAIEDVDELRGRMPAAFLSSTVPSSASCSAAVWSAALVGAWAGEPAVGLSNNPNANIWVRTSDTSESNVVVLTAPVATADRSALP